VYSRGLTLKFSYKDYAAKVETTFKMALKGGVHFMADDSNPVNLTSLHFDGHDHHGREIDEVRVLERLGGLRAYFTLDRNIKSFSDSSDPRKEPHQSYDACQFLQLSDLLVGACRTWIGGAKNLVQKELSQPIGELIDRWHKGSKRMNNSRWNKGIWISMATLENNRWQFSNYFLKDSLTDKQMKFNGY